ncbi:hypothetical protein [Microbacterium hydrothermale]|uniref:hypothetical protein n=1 Tax=Microbacterium hydrothermale TaxID=857427 RepID=UPI0010A80C29|nr:hypothetical protein [Microbacterium hydrothermale]
MVDQNIDLVVSDLTADAQRWDDIAGQFTSAVSTIETLALQDFVMDGLTYALGATSSYNSTHAQILELLRGGATETARIAQALRDTATNMTAADSVAGR